MTNSLIVAHQLSASHVDGTVAFRSVTLHMQPDECIALVGPNGAGKTSFFLSLVGILPCQTGSLRVCGLNPLDPKERQELPGLVGLVMQQSDDQLFNPTVLDDVAFGPLNMGLSRSEARQRVADALSLVKLTGCEDRVPHKLSGGEKRRVALAGILAMQPRLLLLDEPTQDLDPRGRRELINIVNDLPPGKVIASHDLDFVLATCPRTVLLDGDVIADGPTAALLADHELMERHGLEVPWRLRRPEC